MSGIYLHKMNTHHTVLIPILVCDSLPLLTYGSNSVLVVDGRKTTGAISGCIQVERVSDQTKKSRNDGSRSLEPSRFIVFNYTVGDFYETVKLSVGHAGITDNLAANDISHGMQ